MQILLISRCPPFPLYRGDRLIPYYIVRELSERQAQIDLIAFYDKPADLADVPRYERLFRNVTLIREPQRTLRDYLHRVRDRSARFPTSALQSWSPEMWAAIESATRQHTYDVAHLFGGVQVYEYRHLVRSLPNVIVPYESFTLWMERALQETRGIVPRTVKWLQLRMARSFESWMFQDYDRCVMLTERDADALRKLNADLPLVVIPNGVDIDYFTPTGYEPDEPALMFIGNYDYEPNLDAALRLVRDLFPRVRRQVPQARLVIVGGNVPPELQAFASDAVDIPGRVPDLRPYFETAQVFVSPLRLGAGIKNKVLQAMAMRVPVVATPLSCDGIPVLHERHVLLGQTDDDLVSGILRALRDADLRQQLRQNGRSLVEQHFTWGRVADRYEDLYEQVIRERRGFAPTGRA